MPVAASELTSPTSSGDFLPVVTRYRPHPLPIPRLGLVQTDHVTWTLLSHWLLTDSSRYLRSQESQDDDDDNDEGDILTPDIRDDDWAADQPPLSSSCCRSRRGCLGRGWPHNTQSLLIGQNTGLWLASCWVIICVVTTDSPGALSGLWPCGHTRCQGIILSNSALHHGKHRGVKLLRATYKAVLQVFYHL